VGDPNGSPLSRARLNLPFLMPERFRAELAPSAFEIRRRAAGSKLSGQVLSTDSE
jgi:hypothetical protein